LGVVAVDGKIYAIGGSYQTEVPSYDQFPLYLTKYVSTNEMYDPVSDTWVTLESMPTPRAYFAIAAYDNKIYCIGGITVCASNIFTFDYCLLNEVYDTVTNNVMV
jgi:hypothetical protein